MTPAAPGTDRYALAAQIKARAKDIGFDLVGIASARPSIHRDYFHRWLDDGRHATMEYLARRFEERTDLGTYMPGAKSAICVAINYHVPLMRDVPRAARPCSVAMDATDAPYLQGRIARYALGDDYHEVMKPRLHALADSIRRVAPDAQTRCAVDTAPVMEKELAARAGVGWLGKNTCTINDRIGSWLLLGEVITTLDLPADDPATDRCGTCRRCIDACPTRAITAPYQLDARRCISYLTIEHRGQIPPEFHKPIGDWLYGCDICQEVCPWNGKAPPSAHPEFTPRFPSASLDADDVLRWNDDQYKSTLRGSAIKRVKLPVLQRNAAIVSANLQPR